MSSPTLRNTSSFFRAKTTLRRVPILNYTTTIAVEKTVSEIQAMLADAGAQSILIEYDDDRLVSSVSFRLDYQGALVSFRLPAQIDPLYVILQNDDDVPRKLRTQEQAARVAWRIIKVWVASQLAFIEAEQVEMVEVFLPFAQNPQTGETVFKQLVASNFALLTHDN